MKKALLLVLLLAVVGGSANAGTRLNLDPGFVAGVLPVVIDFGTQVQAADTASFSILGQGDAAPEPTVLAATLTFERETVLTGDVVTLDASASTGGDAILSSYSWDVDGDGDYDTVTESPILNIVYSRAGIIDIVVQVTNRLGKTATSAPVRLEIVNRSPIATFEFAMEDGLEGGAVQFKSLSADEDGDVSSWLWDFGDGSLSTEANPRHAFKAGGSYSVSLTVRDDEGAISTPFVSTVSVPSQPPRAVILLQQKTVRAGQPLVLADGSSHQGLAGDVVHVAWDFGDGSYRAGGPSLDNTYTHVYAAPGAYTITLFVIDGRGALTQTRAAVNVL